MLAGNFDFWVLNAFETWKSGLIVNGILIANLNPDRNFGGRLSSSGTPLIFFFKILLLKQVLMKHIHFDETKIPIFSARINSIWKLVTIITFYDWLVAIYNE